jgi:hypothetical protein
VSGVANKLATFRARQITKLLEIEGRLLEKYPGESDRIRFLVDRLVEKLRFLKTRSFASYVVAVYQASREFPEFRELLPKPDEIEGAG